MAQQHRLGLQRWVRLRFLLGFFGEDQDRLSFVGRVEIRQDAVICSVYYQWS